MRNNVGPPTWLSPCKFCFFCECMGCGCIWLKTKNFLDKKDGRQGGLGQESLQGQGPFFFFFFFFLFSLASSKSHVGRTLWIK